MSDWKVKVWMKIETKDTPVLVEEKIFKNKTEKEMKNNTLPKTHRATIEVYDAKRDRKNISDKENTVLGGSI
jgi:hypothetical protein